MGIIDKVATAIVKDAAATAAIGALDAADKGVKAIGEKIDKTFGDKATRHYRKEQKYLSKNPDSTYLIIQKTNVRKDSFSIYDRDENEKYYVHGKLSSGNVNLQLYDRNNQRIGAVKKNLISLRAPVSHESKPADYVIEIYGEKVATLKTRLSTNRENYEISPYGWIIKGSILKWDFTVNDGDQGIVHICKRKGYDSPTYILDFPHEKDEIIGLLIVLTLVCRE